MQHLKATVTKCWCLEQLNTFSPPQPFYGTTQVSRCRRELLDFMVQGKSNRGRHTDHPARRHSIRTNQCLPPPSPIFLQAGCPPCRPTNSVKALKANTFSVSGKTHPRTSEVNEHVWENYYKGVVQQWRRQISDMHHFNSIFIHSQVRMIQIHSQIQDTQHFDGQFTG